VRNEELRNLYSSPSIIRTIKYRMRWTEHVARMGTKRNAYDFGGKTGRKEATRKS
jgi:hypothetical protein